MTSPQPPKFFLRFFRWFSKPELSTFIEGDLTELFLENVKQKGVARARVIFMIEVLKLFRPGIVRSIHSNQLKMPHLFFKTAIRHLAKNRAYSLINVTGLLIGMTTVFFMAKYLAFQLTADDWWEGKEQVYRVNQKEFLGEREVYDRAASFFGFGPMAKSEVASVTAMSRYITTIESLVTAERQDGTLAKYNEPNIVEVDPDFLQMVPLTFIQGGEAALDDPNSVVVSESMAKKYFGKTDVLGEVLKTTLPWGASYNLRITGVFKDLPPNAGFRFQFLKSLVGKDPKEDPLWSFPSYRTYLKIEEGAGVADLEQQLATSLNELPFFESLGKTFELYFERQGEVEISQSQGLLILVGLLVLGITWVNYVSLSSAKMLSRLKEMGVRRIIGSGKRMLVVQFMAEGLMLCGLALLLLVVIILWLYPYVESLTYGQILPLSEFSSPVNLTFILLFLACAFLGSYMPVRPFLSAAPILQLKGKASGKASRFKLQGALVVFQFSISIILLVSVFVIMSQLKLLRNQGFQPDVSQTLVIKTTKDGWDGKLARHASFKQQAKALSQVQNVSSSTTVPGENIGSSVFKVQGGNVETQITMMGVDLNYFQLYDIPLLAGKSFEENRFDYNRRVIVLSRSAALALGFERVEDAIGAKIEGSRFENISNYRTVIGVVEDYHHTNVKEGIRPLLFDYNPFRGHVSIRFESAVFNDYASLTRTIDELEHVWDEIYAGQAFDYYFVDEAFNEQYREEELFQKIFTVFGVVSVAITCLSLIGLSMFSVARRRKEVGIRKTLGASVLRIFILFSSDFFGQIILASLLGAPIAYYLMTQWLSDFSYRTEITVLTLLVPCLLMFVIAWLALSYETFKAALVNPVDVLKDE